MPGILITINIYCL